MSHIKRSSPSGPVVAQKITAAVNLGTVAANVAPYFTLAVAGITTLDCALITVKDTLLANLAIGSAMIATADEIQFAVANPTAGGIAQNTTTFDITVVKFST